jgi:CHASE1-domain containing sensor protein
MDDALDTFITAAPDPAMPAPLAPTSSHWLVPDPERGPLRETPHSSGQVRLESPGFPERIGEFILLRPLARGGMGMVYLAHDPRLKRLVALKMLRGGEGAKPEELARLRAEAEAVARLRHPNIVQIYEIGQQDGLPFLVLEYINGGSLSQRLGGQPIPAIEAVRLLLSLSRAMGHAHQLGIIHRDLKPGNVLLQQDNADGLNPPLARMTPKITDFGLAKVPGHLGQTQSGMILGTLYYMAPEQAAGQPELYGPPMDVYALGVILYEMLTTRLPFNGTDPMAMLDRIRWQAPIPPSRCQPDIPRDLETICLKCLRKEPVERYATANELAEDLQRFLDGEPILARPISAPEAAWKWVRRFPARAALIAVSLLSVLTLLGACMAVWRSATLAEYNERLQKALNEAQEQRSRAEAAEFLNLAENHLDALQKSLSGNLEIAYSLSAYVQSLPAVSPSAFRQFAESAVVRHDDLLALEWLPRVTEKERPAFEALARLEGFPQYQIRELDTQEQFQPAAPRAEYFPIFFRAPLAPHSKMAGMDHAALPPRRRAMQRACDTGQPAITGLVRYRTDKPEQEREGALVVYVPVYAPGTHPQTVEQRRQHLRGFAALFLDMRQMLRTAWKTVDRHQELDAFVADVTDGGQDVIYWERAGRPAEDKQPPPHLREKMLARSQHWEQSFTVLSRKWRILCATSSPSS